MNIDSMPIEIPTGRARDLRGKKFGRLEPLYRTESKNTKTRWVCKCDCGNSIKVDTSSLISGNTQSCGCLAKDLLVKRDKEMAVDLSNQRFGKLIALYPTNERENGSIIWKCQCDCGAFCYKSVAALLQRGARSCGCDTMSRGERSIKTILEENDIDFELQKTFDDCAINGNKLRFDFYLPKQNTLIEFDGEQHFHAIDLFGGEERFKKQQQYDLYKNDYCRRKHIALIRIPYTHLNKLSVSDLFIETSCFREV